MLKHGALCLVVSFLLLITMSCSAGGGMAVTPTEEATGISTPATGRATDSSDSHCCLGLYQCTVDKEAGTLDFVPMRTTEMHLNALPFLEPPPLVNLTLESLQFNGNIIEVNIGLRHPFIGLTEFTGFDVCGIFITAGSKTGYADPDICHAGPDDTYLVNPVGYSRWWNPVEFPVNPGTMFGYKDGLLGTPNSTADFSSTINGYKYFCDDLTPDGSVSGIDLNDRGMFSAGKKNIRHYTIKLGTGGLVFNYAIDACWEFPTGDKPWTAPGSFGPNANRPEPWFISVTENLNTLSYYDGHGEGGINLTIDVYDWANSGQDQLYIEALGGVIPESGPYSPSAGGEGYSTYEVEITSASPTEAGPLNILITVETENDGFQNFIPGAKTSAYLVYTTTVSDEPVTVHTVTGIKPAYGKPDSKLDDVEVYGTGFIPGGALAVSLKLDGEPDIVATGVNFVDENNLTCSIHIPTDAALDSWDVGVTNGDGTNAVGEDLFEVYDCGKMLPSTSGGYIVTSPPGTMFGEWCGVTCTREGTSYLIATGPIHNTFAAIKATANGGSSEFTGDAGGYLEFDLACTSDNIIYYSIAEDPSMIYRISFDPSTGFGKPEKFAPIDDMWWVHRICVDDNDNPIVLADEIATYDKMKICHWNGTDWDKIDLPKEIIGPGDKYVQDFDYNPVLDQYVFACIDGSKFYTDMFAMDRDGNTVLKELDVFNWNHDETWFPGIYIDQDDPQCHIFIWGALEYSSSLSVPRPSARFDALYGGKSGSNMPTTAQNGPGLPKGAWAPGTDRLFTPSMGGNVISWFTLPSDW